MTQFFSYIISRFSSPKKISKIKNISFLLSYNSKPLTKIISLTKTPRPSYLNFKIFSTGPIFILAYCYIKDLRTIGLIFLILLERRSPLPYGIMLRTISGYLEFVYGFRLSLTTLSVHQFPLSFILLETHFRISSRISQLCSHRWFLLTFFY